MFWIGLQIEDECIKWAKLYKKGSQVYLAELEMAPLSEGTLVNPLYFMQKTENQEFFFISGLETSDVLLRELSIQFSSRRKIAKLLPFQLEPLIPYPQEEAVISAQMILNKRSSSSTVLFLAAKISALLSHKNKLKQIELEPDQVASVPSALCRFVSHFFPDLHESFVVDMGYRSSSIVYVKEGRLFFSYPLSWGFIDFSKENSCADQLQKELDRALSCLLQKIKHHPETILFTGYFSCLPKVKELLFSSLPEGIYLLSCQEKDALYAVPVGLALEGLLLDGKSHLFCQGALSSDKSQKKRKKALFNLGLASCAAALVCVFGGALYTSQKTKQLCKEFSSVMQVHSLEELELMLTQKEIELAKGIAPYALSPPLPLVHEVLAFLSSNPSSVDIRKIQYELVKYPKKGAKKTPYQGKVHLEADIQDLAQAKTFQETLKNSSYFLDTKQEFSIENTGHNYQISFFLQTKGGQP